MIKCTNPECGAENEDGAKFCAECGTPFSDGPVDAGSGTPVSDELVCPECGAKCEPGTQFCGECGHSFEEEDEEESVVSQFFSACVSGDLDTVNNLIDQVDLSVTDDHEMNALHYAAKNGQLEIIQTLAEHGCDIQAVDSDGWTALHFAAAAGSDKVCGLLLDRGIQIDMQAENGETPLHLAARGKKAGAAKFLVERGADVNVHDSDGDTPLHGAASSGDLELVQFLIGHGADAAARNNSNKTPEAVADEAGKSRIAEYLYDLQNGCSEDDDDDTVIKRLSDMLNDITEGSVYGDGNIPDKKLTNAVASYANGLITKDEALLLVDNTVFGSAKEGCLVSGQFFISKATMEQPVYLRLKKGMKFEVRGDSKIACSGKVIFEASGIEKSVLRKITSVLTLLSRLA